ncbi:hypothetical protein [Chryseobacterium luquanense]|uniref:Peptidase M10 metallopeptidase domain-containing protein n=1 Tax=Chryseobacterium luquanense TaxID=2983766 RepID=A0ABT3Y829_9FLAO|nr:hypothetical protein [Chryseobacterium luquanense]MCX8534320.1 hypothetical protein [Chryseobacterium luquanense]
MGHITKSTPYFDININSDSGNIVIVQKWKYEWKANGFSEWQYPEKLNIHEKFEKAITSTWNGKAKVKVLGTSEFAKQNVSKVFTILFDVKWVTTNAHWDVIVSKLNRFNNNSRPVVDWNGRRIELYTMDVIPVGKKGAPKGLLQTNVVHEFGHSIGNHSNIKGMHNDEYSKSKIINKPYLEDKTSIMHSGMELRKRHFDYLEKVLNEMIPNTKFSISV